MSTDARQGRGAITRPSLKSDVWAVLFAIERERHAQNDRWGEQNHPNIPAWMSGADNEALGVPTADEARRRCELSFDGGYPNWAEILVEEVAEALEEVDDDVALRVELIQVAAVATAWVESIDRRAGSQPQVRVLRDDDEAS